MTECQECGMPVEVNEYHPYAACLMFKACHSPTVVRDNLNAAVEQAREEALMVAAEWLRFSWGGEPITYEGLMRRADAIANLSGKKPGQTTAPAEGQDKEGEG